MASDDDFVVLRKFDQLHIRVLLTMQDNLAELEEQLRNLDEQFAHRNAPDIDNGSIRKDQPERIDLLNRIQLKLVEYCEQVIRFLIVNTTSYYSYSCDGLFLCADEDHGRCGRE